ncbi:uncharacterized protein LOC143599411 [Bidens hawaiensis]|uniref:uncharacterized protein LOC143599411 n=1 Tax=Bidens hawaiensis TaxID=980011 RepID=UPI00404ADD22
MEDDTPQNVMNLDLNLGPVETDPGGFNLENWLDGHGPGNDSFEPRTMVRRRRWRSIWRPVRLPTETGEGSVPAADRMPPPELTKTCDENCNNNSNGPEENEVTDRKEHKGGFFDCNICFNMASEPVVTYCGHLFCWPCLYRWLHLHSDVKECPICKGEMTIKTITPIYGRGNPTRVVEEDSDLKIPNRPQAKRVEGFRQTIQRNMFTMPMEEMIRRLGSRFDLTRDLVPENPREISDRSNSLLNRYLASRRLRTDQEQDQDPALAEPPRVKQWILRLKLIHGFRYLLLLLEEEVNLRGCRMLTVEILGLLEDGGCFEKGVSVIGSFCLNHGVRASRVMDTFSGTVFDASLNVFLLAVFGP